MAKAKKILYWFFTLWASLGMTATGLVQIFKWKTNQNYDHLGFPAYFFTLIGIWKLLGVITILVPRLPLLKEWAYAGFFFVMTGAIFSHIANGDSFRDMFPALLLLTLVSLSWYFRPRDRRIILA